MHKPILIVAGAALLIAPRVSAQLTRYFGSILTTPLGGVQRIAEDPAFGRMISIDSAGKTNVWSIVGNPPTNAWVSLINHPGLDWMKPLATRGTGAGATVVHYESATGTLMEFANNAWNVRFVSPNGPINRTDFMMAGLPNGDVVVFGGQNNNGLLAETWTWNGTAWIADSGPQPPARIYGCLALEANSTLLLYGGWGTAGPLGDVWRFTPGTGWAQVPTTNTPSARYLAGMARARDTNEMVLVGGNDTAGWLPEAHVLSGSTWTQITSSLPGTPGAWFDCAFDATRNEVLALEWVGFRTLPTGLLGSQSRGAGCNCGAAPPMSATLGAGGIPAINNSFKVQINNAPAGSALFVMFGPQAVDAAVPMPAPFPAGCNLHLTAISGSVAAPNGSVVVNVPQDANLVGMSIGHQGVTFGPVFCVSDGLSTRIGR